MTKRPKKHEKPLTIDKDFDEALGRLAQVSSSELPDAGAGEVGPVRLMEDDPGHRFLVYVTDKGARHELRYTDEQPRFTQKQLADSLASTPTQSACISRTSLTMANSPLQLPRNSR